MKIKLEQWMILNVLEEETGDLLGMVSYDKYDETWHITYIDEIGSHYAGDEEKTKEDAVQKIVNWHESNAEVKK